MALPSIKIQFLNGQLGTVADSRDGLLALVCGATAVGSTFALRKAYPVYRPAGLEDLGVTEENNPALHRHVRDFYNEAEEGTPLVVFGVEKATKMAALCDKDSGPLKALLQGQKGELRGLVIARDADSESVTAEDGIDPDVTAALPKAQALAEWAATELYAPVFVALEGRGYEDAAELPDLGELACNRVCVVIGDTAAGSKGAAMGVFAGRVAASPVQRNIGRVADGPLAPAEMFVGGRRVEDAMADDIVTLYDKGYVTPRTYTGRSGYFFTDDRMAADPTDDYAHLANRRVIDKACRIAYDTLLDFMLDEVRVNTDGTMQDAVLKSWQAAVENAIRAGMTARGELSADTSAGESGCSVHIDPSQNVLATSTVLVTLKVRPFGYARNVEVQLGFQVESNA